MTKHSKLGLSLLTGLVLAFGPAALPAVAQETPEDVLALCSAAGATEETCDAAIDAYFAYLESQGIEGVALEQAVAELTNDIAVAVNSGALPASTAQVLIAAVRYTAESYATPAQRAQIQQVADTLQAQNPQQTDDTEDSPT